MALSGIKIFGYVKNGQFGDYAMPVPFQNLILRDYAKKNGFIYVLPNNEICFENNYTIFNTLIQKLKKKSNIVCCSVFMLPNKKTEMKKMLNILKKKKPLTR